MQGPEAVYQGAVLTCTHVWVCVCVYVWCATLWIPTHTLSLAPSASLCLLLVLVPVAYALVLPTFFGPFTQSDDGGEVRGTPLPPYPDPQYQDSTNRTEPNPEGNVCVCEVCRSLQEPGVSKQARRLFSERTKKVVNTLFLSLYIRHSAFLRTLEIGHWTLNTGTGGEGEEP